MSSKKWALGFVPVAIAAGALVASTAIGSADDSTPPAQERLLPAALVPPAVVSALPPALAPLIVDGLDWGGLVPALPTPVPGVPVPGTGFAGGGLVPGVPPTDGLPPGLPTDGLVPPTEGLVPPTVDGVPPGTVQLG